MSTIPIPPLHIPDDMSCMFCSTPVPADNGCAWVWSHSVENKATLNRMLENGSSPGCCYIINEQRRCCSDCWKDYLLETLLQQSTAAAER